MLSTQGKKYNREAPLTEYPTPQFERDSYFSLNGVWDFSLDQNPKNHDSYPYEIVVPFAVESELSGVEQRVKPGDIMHYRKEFEVPEGFVKSRVLIHFEAVDQVCDVYLNGVLIAHHEGGYLPFTADCMELRPGKNELLVDVTDDTSSPLFPRGKQSLKPKGIWYTATSGIWGSVWLESVPNQVIQSLRIDPLFDEKKVRVKVQFEGKVVTSKVTAFYKGREVASGSLDASAEVTLSLIGNFKEWSPENPQLYDLAVEVNSDRIKSYFAMRKFSKVMHNGHLVFGLNNKPYFLTGVLDQGYYSDGGLTPPTDEAMIQDLQMLKDMGFNMVRKHIKIEPMRWYHHCDRLGLIVIQDFVNLGDPVRFFLFALAPFFKLKIDDTQQQKLLGVGNLAARERFESEMKGALARLYNVPSIAVWTIFNEGWGQFDSVRITSSLRLADSSRLIDSASGWFDQGAGDFDSRHIYMRKINVEGDGQRILSLSECGAYSLAIEGHCAAKNGTFYKRFHSQEKLWKAISSLYEKEILPAKDHGLSVVVYTQLSDVEGEINGLVTYDRRLRKVDAAKMRRLNEKLFFQEVHHD